MYCNSSTNNPTKPMKFFHCYATANDRRYYLRDIFNLHSINKKKSGINKIFLFIAISEVNELNIIDKMFVNLVKKIFKTNDTIQLVDIFFKDNIGRDFSSYNEMFLRLKAIATDNDYIFFQNRSAYGPFSSGWYRAFIDQYEKFEDTALCGSTINFYYNSKNGYRNYSPHVQTFSFLSKVSQFLNFGNSFPGINETVRTNVIRKGEITLSQYFLQKKQTITSLEWPEIEVTIKTPPKSYVDIKGNVKSKHYFYHWSYFRNNNFFKIMIVLKGWLKWLKYVLFNI